MKAPVGPQMPRDTPQPCVARPDRRRRQWLKIVAGWAFGVGMAALGMASGLWAVLCARFLWPNTVAEAAQRFKVGTPGEYPWGKVQTRYSQQHGVWVVHGTYRGRRQIFALSTVCTHLGCITTWQEGQRRFKCPCHGSGFSPEGMNLEGPAPRPLERYAIRLTQDGQLEVDKSRRFREDLGQWADPASFVEI